ncbi:protein sel-1 homolog 3 isoform X1 [Takifugu flavidus]|uniref:protein sel-1 homolog 3 isoform X1 n=1 Tax=Takifugu flavidus TaxID=433684 RepID=UPI00254400CE|nr:protein sel-1 homolog 3 isoform X1 [Takifugu flavidus]
MVLGHIYVSTAAIVMGLCVSQQTVSSAWARTGESTPDNYIGFQSVPDRVADGSLVRLRYRCSRPCRLRLEVVVPTLRKTDLVVFRRKWACSIARVYRVQQVRLRWPLPIFHQNNFIRRSILDARSVTFRAWLDHRNESGTYHKSLWRICRVLQLKSLARHPAQRSSVCLSWPAQLKWNMTRNTILPCAHESGMVDMLKFPLASSGENFGVVRRFQPFIDRNLERARVRAVTRPSVALSVWIYLLEWCHQKLCGIIHHLDRNDSYESVLMQLTDAGDVIIQARLARGEDEAFRTSLHLPLRKWIRLDCYIQDSKVLLDATWDGDIHRYVYMFQDSVRYDDTDGYFVIGGSRFVPGIHGYFGPTKYYRFGIKEVRNPLPNLHKLDGTHQECQEMEQLTAAFLGAVTESVRQSRMDEGETGVCVTQFLKLWTQFGKNVSPQPWTWEQQLQYRTLFNVLQTQQEEIKAGTLTKKQLRHILFEEAVDAIFTADQAENKISSRSRALLQASSCFGNHQASLLLATIHLSGLRQEVDQEQGHVYSLIGAAGDDRFALMHAGYKHTQGIDGFPKDLAMAYSYYSNAGAQSSADSFRVHEKTQHNLEHIYLSEEGLTSLDVVNNDVFEYLKFQAERGDIESQKHLATMMYWGRHGVSKDPVGALRWFEKSALQMKDASAVYDYSILLMKGLGVKRNYTRGLRLMEKAAAMGSINALNGLGWYHGIIRKDHENAVKYFERAALNGSSDAMFNLGIYHASGKNPNSPFRNETAAFQQFLNASRLGHVGASVEVAWYLSTGNLEGVSQDVERAVILLKRVCELNGHLGFMIKEALNAYLQGSWQRALVKYALAAESGLNLAQINAAHLCEEAHVSQDCGWRYHNHSILNYDPHPSALLKMGDYYRDLSSRTGVDSLSLLGQAILMYSRAAAAGSPQGLYNVVDLVERGHVLPGSARSWFNVSRLDNQDVVVEKILKRCVQTEDEELITPCSVALLRVQMRKALRRMTQKSAQLVLAYAALLSVGVISVTIPLQNCLERAVRRRARASSVREGGSDLNREQDGVTGGGHGTLRARWVSILNREQRLQQIGDVAVTLSGVCLCAFWTTLLYHLL